MRLNFPVSSAITLDEVDFEFIYAIDVCNMVPRLINKVKI